MPESAVAAAPVAEVKPPVPDAAPAAAPAAPEPAPGLLGGEPAKPATAAAPAAPEAIAYDFKLPEGAVADDELMGQFKAVAGELKIPADKAQALVDMGMKIQEQQAEAISQAWQEQRASWVESLKSDPDWGGAKFSKTVEDANRALRQFGDQELLNDLRELGLDSHPGLVRAFARVARSTAEDRSIERPGGGIASSGRNYAEVLYPGQGKS